MGPYAYQSKIPFGAVVALAAITVASVTAILTSEGPLSLPQCSASAADFLMWQRAQRESNRHAVAVSGIVVGLGTFLCLVVTLAWVRVRRMPDVEGVADFVEKIANEADPNKIIKRMHDKSWVVDQALKTSVGSKISAAEVFLVVIGMFLFLLAYDWVHWVMRDWEPIECPPSEACDPLSCTADDDFVSECRILCPSIMSDGE